VSKKLKSTLNNPSLLKSLSKDDGIIQVVIETPKGSRNKYAFDEKQRVFLGSTAGGRELR
jgi:inorganic pyrophosphatase